MSYFKEARSILSALRQQRMSGATSMQIQDQLVDGLGRAKEFSQLDDSSSEWEARQRHRVLILQKLLKRHT